MTVRILAAGLAVALMAAPAAFAEERNPPVMVAQADPDASQFLADTRPLSSLSDKELKQRMRAGRQLVKGGTLSPEDRKKVRAAIQAANQELKGRGSADTAASQGGDDAGAGQTDLSGETAAQGEASQPSQKTAQDTTQAPAGGGGAAEFLADTRPLDGLSDKEVRQRFRAGRDLVQGGKLSPADRKKVRDVVLALRQEMQKRTGKAGDQAAGNDQSQTSADQGAAQGKGGGGAAEFLADNRPLDQLNDKDLRQRMRTGRQLMKDSSVSQADRKKIQQAVRSARLEIAKRGNGQAGQQNNENMDQADAGQAAGESGDNAQQVMADAGDAAKLDDQALRKRMKVARDSLGGGKLTPAETKALREKLAADRRELRQRVAKKVGSGQGGGDEAVIDWLQDRRESRSLKDRELERRIAFYRARLNKGDLTAEQKEKFRLILDHDRLEFRSRALAHKDERLRDLKRRVASNEINIQININPQGAAYPVGVPPPPVWAAEADDEMIMTQLVRRPARNFDRRYTIAEIEAEPELREALPAVEIDTINFGFNEDQVSEDQLENLDRIGGILEEILAAHPREVFLIEGHTDAVGDGSL